MSETVTIPLHTYLELKKYKEDFDAKTKSFALSSWSTYSMVKFVTEPEYALELRNQLGELSSQIYDKNRKINNLENKINAFERKSFIGKALHSFNKNSPD